MKHLKKLNLKKISFFILVGSLVYYIFFVNNKPQTHLYNYITIERKDLLQKVSATGQVKAKQTVDLAFEKSGKIIRTNVEVGDKVKKGTLLVELEGDELWADLLEAKASIERETAELEDLKQGTKPEEIEVYKAKVSKSKTSLEDAKKNLLLKLQETYTQADDVVRNRIDPLFESPRTNPQITFQTNNANLKNQITQQRQEIEAILTDWHMVLQHLWIKSDLDKYIEKTQNNLTSLKGFLDDIALLVNGIDPDSRLTQTTIDTWKENTSLSRTVINTAFNEVNLAKEKLNATETGLLQDEKELVLKRSSATPQSITVYGAEVKSAEARLNRVYARISKNLIKAPFDGIVTKSEAKKGEIVLPEMIMVSLIGEGIEIKANIPEIDISKVKLNDVVEITFDAIEDKEYVGTVGSINPVGESIQGVVYYETTVNFGDENDLSTVKPGMTADLEVLTDKRERVLSVPQRSVITKDGKKYLKVLIETKNEEGLPEDKEEEKEVKTGMKGSDGEIEIRDGIADGERVIISLNNH